MKIEVELNNMFQVGDFVRLPKRFLVGEPRSKDSLFYKQVKGLVSNIFCTAHGQVSEPTDFKVTQIRYEIRSIVDDELIGVFEEDIIDRYHGDEESNIPF